MKDMINMTLELFEKMASNLGFAAQHVKKAPQIYLQTADAADEEG